MENDEEVPSMYWDDNEDSEGYKEDGCPWIFNEEELVDQLRARLTKDIKTTVHTYVDGSDGEFKATDYKVYKGQIGTVVQTSGYWNQQEEKYEMHYVVKWDGFNTYMDLFIPGNCIELIDAGINMYGLPKDHPWKKRREVK